MVDLMVTYRQILVRLLSARQRVDAAGPWWRPDPPHTRPGRRTPRTSPGGRRRTEDGEECVIQCGWWPPHRHPTSSGAHFKTKHLIVSVFFYHKSKKSMIFGYILGCPAYFTHRAWCLQKVVWCLLLCATSSRLKAPQIYGTKQRRIGK